MGIAELPIDEGIPETQYAPHNHDQEHQKHPWILNNPVKHIGQKGPAAIQIERNARNNDEQHQEQPFPGFRPLPLWHTASRQTRFRRFFYETTITGRSTQKSSWGQMDFTAEQHHGFQIWK